MLTAQFLNLVCSYLLDDTITDRKNDCSDIREILDFYSNNYDIPAEFSKKFELTKVILDHVENGDDLDVITDSIFTAKKFEELHSFVQSAINKQLTEEQKEKAKDQIHKRSKLMSFLGNYKDIVNFIDSFETNSFDSIDELIEYYENILKQMYNSYTDKSRKENIETSSSLDLFDDSYDSVLQELKEDFSGKRSVTTGYHLLDKYMYKGFEPRRLYIFCGASGDGKSTLLINLLNNVLESNSNLEDGYKDLFVYFTFENLITESLSRIYCCSKELDYYKLANNFSNFGSDIKSHLRSKQQQNGKILTMEYYPARQVSSSELLTKIDEIKEKYSGEAKVRGIFIDYLDLMKANQNFDLTRMELGQITLDLKVLSIFCDAPVITVTQVNRSGYDKDTPSSMTQVGESIQKVEHADFIAMLKSLSGEQNDDGTDKIQLEIHKNRSGPKNRKVYFKSDFSKYRLYDLRQQVNVPFEEENSSFEVADNVVPKL